MYLVAQLFPTLCNPMDCSPPGSYVLGDSPGKNIGVGCHFLLQGIFPMQGSNPGLPHCRWILYQLSHKGSKFSIYRENMYVGWWCCHFIDENLRPDEVAWPVFEPLTTLPFSLASQQVLITCITNNVLI